MTDSITHLVINLTFYTLMVFSVLTWTMIFTKFGNLWRIIVKTTYLMKHFGIHKISNTRGVYLTKFTKVHNPIWRMKVCFGWTNINVCEEKVLNTRAIQTNYLSTLCVDNCKRTTHARKRFDLTSKYWQHRAICGFIWYGDGNYARDARRY